MIDKPVKVWITSIKIIQSGLARLTLRSTLEAQLWIMSVELMVLCRFSTVIRYVCEGCIFEAMSLTHSLILSSSVLTTF